MTTNKQTPVQRYANYGVDMMEWAEGGYVKYDDYQLLLDELEAAERRVTEIELPLPTCTYADHSYPAYSKKQVIQILAAAGITTKGE